MPHGKCTQALIVGCGDRPGTPAQARHGSLLSRLPLQVAGAFMSFCALRASGNGGDELSISGLWTSQPLVQLLATLLPSTASLERLSIAADHPPFVSLGLQGCSQLAGLHALSVSGFRSLSAAGLALPALRCVKLASSLDGQGLDAALSSLILAAPGLTEAELTGLGSGGANLEALPSLVASQQLRKLKLAPAGASPLSSLPAGPYLAVLEELDLSDCNLRQLPAALAAATRLRRLSLERNSTLQISTPDVEAILDPLQQLSRLDPDSWWRHNVSPAAVHALGKHLPQLEVPTG
ncbi:hypothetical protein ABPG75_007844 [Micractinium tetrahymenae]